MKTISIEIPQFIRRVKISEKQRAKFFVWNGTHIAGKGQEVPLKFIKDEKRESLMNNNGKAVIEHLKDNFSIAIVKDKKVVSTTRNTASLPNKFEMLTEPECKGYKYILVKSVDDLNFKRVEFVKCNENKIGKPKYEIINGQNFYNGVLNEHVRGTIIHAIKQNFKPYVEAIKSIDFLPVRIEMRIYDTIKSPFDSTKNSTGRRWDVDNFSYPYCKAFPDLLKELGKIPDDCRLNITQPPSPIFYPIEDHNDRKLVFIITEDIRPIIKNHPIYSALEVVSKQVEKVSWLKEQEEKFKEQIKKDAESIAYGYKLQRDESGETNDNKL